MNTKEEEEKIKRIKNKENKEKKDEVISTTNKVLIELFRRVTEKKSKQLQFQTYHLNNRLQIQSLWLQTCQNRRLNFFFIGFIATSDGFCQS